MILGQYGVVTKYIIFFAKLLPCCASKSIILGKITVSAKTEIPEKLLRTWLNCTVL